MNRLEQAMKLYEKTHFEQKAHRLVVAGGVAANKTLSSTLQKLCDRQKYQLVVPPMQLCTDNAAMIAWAGMGRFLRGETDDLSLSCRARWPLDPDAPAASLHGKK